MRMSMRNRGSASGAAPVSMPRYYQRPTGAVPDSCPLMKNTSTSLSTSKPSPSAAAPEPEDGDSDGAAETADASAEVPAADELDPDEARVPDAVLEPEVTRKSPTGLA